MVVIGGTGHIGTYLVPSLVKAGHDVAVISRGSRRAYRDDPVWRDVDMVVCDVAGLHQACLDQPDAAAGQSLNSVCTQAFTLRGHADVVARHLGLSRGWSSCHGTDTVLESIDTWVAASRN